ncbi:MAG: tetratricopeptide repeat protein [Pseudomonadota bacterium]
MGRWRTGILVALCMTLTTPLWAQPASAQNQGQRQAPLPPLPWDADAATLQAALPDLKSGGITGLASHVTAFEAALTNGKQFFPDGVTIDSRRYIPVDGRREGLLVALKATLTQSGGAVTAVGNPYPSISKLLGTYYDEIGKLEDGIRVLDEGLALSPDPEARAGALTVSLIGEKGFALAALKRYPESLAVYEQGIALNDVPPLERAILYRGKGLIMTETNRLDEAEAAYQESLKLDPGNPRAQNELIYIARLRAGRPATPVEMILPPGAQKPIPQPPQEPSPN